MELYRTSSTETSDNNQYDSANQQVYLSYVMT